MNYMRRLWAGLMRLVVIRNGVKVVGNTINRSPGVPRYIKV